MKTIIYQLAYLYILAASIVFADYQHTEIEIIRTEGELHIIKVNPKFNYFVNGEFIINTKTNQKLDLIIKDVNGKNDILLLTGKVLNLKKICAIKDFCAGLSKQYATIKDQDSNNKNQNNSYSNNTSFSFIYNSNKIIKIKGIPIEIPGLIVKEIDLDAGIGINFNKILYNTSILNNRITLGLNSGISYFSNPIELQNEDGFEKVNFININSNPTVNFFLTDEIALNFGPQVNLLVIPYSYSYGGATGEISSGFGIGTNLGILINLDNLIITFNYISVSTPINLDFIIKDPTTGIILNKFSLEKEAEANFFQIGIGVSI